MKIELRKMKDTDREIYLELANEVWVNKKLLQDEKHNDLLWKTMFSNTEMHYAVLMEHQICGFVSIMKLDKEVQEIGIELFRKYHHQGIGYIALTQLLQICKREYNILKIQSKVYADNFPSILLVKKMGGVPCGITRNPCIAKHLELEFQKNNKDLISDNVKEVAKVFGVRPEMLISNLLLFEIPIESEENKFNILLTGNLNYEKKIETRASNYMISCTRQWLENLLKNSTDKTRNKVIEETLETLDFSEL